MTTCSSQQNFLRHHQMTSQIPPDLLRHGDDIQISPAEGNSRFAFQNGNGVVRDISEPACDVLDVVALFELDHFGIAEPNCTVNDEFKDAVNAQARKRFGNGITEGGSRAMGGSASRPKLGILDIWGNIRDGIGNPILDRKLCSS